MQIPDGFILSKREGLISVNGFLFLQRCQSHSCHSLHFLSGANLRCRVSGYISVSESCIIIYNSNEYNYVIIRQLFCALHISDSACRLHVHVNVIMILMYILPLSKCARTAGQPTNTSVRNTTWFISHARAHVHPFPFLKTANKKNEQFQISYTFRVNWVILH